MKKYSLPDHAVPPKDDFDDSFSLNSGNAYCYVFLHLGAIKVHSMHGKLYYCNLHMCLSYIYNTHTYVHNTYTYIRANK